MEIKKQYTKDKIHSGDVLRCERDKLVCYFMVVCFCDEKYALTAIGATEVGGDYSKDWYERGSMTTDGHTAMENYESGTDLDRLIDDLEKYYHSVKKVPFYGVEGKSTKEDLND